MTCGAAGVASVHRHQDLDLLVLVGDETFESPTHDVVDDDAAGHEWREDDLAAADELDHLHTVVCVADRGSITRSCIVNWAVMSRFTGLVWMASPSPSVTRTASGAASSVQAGRDFVRHRCCSHGSGCQTKEPDWTAVAGRVHDGI